MAVDELPPIWTTGRAIGVRNFAGRKHGGRGRGIPKEGLRGEGASNIPESRGKGNVEDEVSKAAARARALDRPGHLTTTVNDEPSVDMGLSEQGSEMTLAKVSLNDGRLGKHP